MADWGLPDTVWVAGEQWSVYTDFRDILQILEVLEQDEDTQRAAYTALCLFYKQPVEPQLYEEAWQALCDFIGCGEPAADKPGPKLIDWRQDSGMIAAEVNRVAGCEVRGLPYLHWFTFMGYFSCIGQGQLATVVAIRQKRARGKKLEGWEQEFYRANRHRVDFAKRYTKEQQAEKQRLLKRLKGGQVDKADD